MKMYYLCLRKTKLLIDMNKITHELVQDLGPVESKKLFMWVEPNMVPAFPKGREDNTHLNIYGGRVVAGLAANAIAQAVPKLAKYILHYDCADKKNVDAFAVQRGKGL